MIEMSKNNDIQFMSEESEAEIERIRDALGESIDIIQSILDDPDVCNVFKCHVDYDDLAPLTNVFNEALKEADR